MIQVIENVLRLQLMLVALMGVAFFATSFMGCSSVENKGDDNTEKVYIYNYDEDHEYWA